MTEPRTLRKCPTRHEGVEFVVQPVSPEVTLPGGLALEYRTPFCQNCGESTMRHFCHFGEIQTYWPISNPRVVETKPQSWIEITDDPKSLPPERKEVLILTGASRIWQAYRRGEWFEAPIDKGVRCWNIAYDVKYWREIGPLPAPPEG